MFVIAETALVFIAEQVMDNAVFETARLIRTGQVQEAGDDEGRTSRTRSAAACRSSSTAAGANFYLDVKSYPTFGDDGGGRTRSTTRNNFEDAGTFAFGEANDIVVVRAYYQWPTNTIFGSLSLKNLSNGKRLIGSFAAFRNEPFTRRLTMRTEIEP